MCDPPRGKVSRSPSHVGGYDDSVTTDAKDADWLPGGRAAFGPKSQNDFATGSAGYRDRVSPYRRRSGNSSELGEYDCLAALHGSVERRRDHDRHGRASDGGVG